MITTDTLLLAGIILVVGLLLGLGVAFLIWGGPGASKRKETVVRREVQRAQKLESTRLWTKFKQIAQLTDTLNYQRVLDTALDTSQVTLFTPGENDTGLVCAVLLFNPLQKTDPELLVAASRRFTRQDQSVRFPGENGLLKEAIDEGAPILTKKVEEDPELTRLHCLNGYHAAYCYPLRAGLDNYGTMFFAHPAPDFFDAERRETLDFIGHQSVTALQNAKLYQDLAQEKERMMEVQEDSRKKLARDLHDGPTQSIAAIAMRINFTRRLMEKDIDTATSELVKIEDLARKTTKEIRHMLFTLRPLVLESQGLRAALESMAEKMRETYSQDVLISIDPEIVVELEMNKQGVIFYIVEEAVTNARKHANANNIWVRLRSLRTDMALLEIEDDGKGFDVDYVESAYENRGSLGMVNMRERTELINGLLHLNSTKGKGTLIQVAIPLSEDAADQLHNRV